MQEAAIPPDEQARLEKLGALELLDSPPDPDFDRITRLLAKALAVPIALVSLIDAQRQWFKSRVGLAVSETPREYAFCAHTLALDAPMVVEDAGRDPRFVDNPLVVDDPGIRFYAGVPIRTRDGTALGTLCAIDRRPRELSREQLDILVDLAELVSKEIQLREAAIAARRQVDHSQALAVASESRFRTIFERAPVGIALLTLDGRWQDVNPALCEILGYSADELLRLSYQGVTHPDDLAKSEALVARLAQHEVSRLQTDKRYLRKDGSVIWVSLSLTIQHDATGTPEYFVAIIKDIHARKEAETQLAALQRDLERRVEVRTHELSAANAALEAALIERLRFENALLKREAELRAVLENANDAYVSMDDKGMVTAWNLQAQETFGWLAEEAIGRPLDELIIPPEMRAAHRAGMQRYLASGEEKVLNRRLELSGMRKDGSLLPVEVRISALDFDGATVFSAFLHDITERKRTEEARLREARLDPLTGLPNRRALHELLPRAMARVARSGQPLALCFIDLDGFKEVNDSFGHEAGDEVLKEIAHRLRARVRQTDSVARLAGDEFVVLLEGLPQGMADARAVAEELLADLRRPIPVTGGTAQLSASIGIALHAQGNESTPEQLVKRADLAMYEAKRAGKDRVATQAP